MIRNYWLDMFLFTLIAELFVILLSEIKISKIYKSIVSGGEK